MIEMFATSTEMAQIFKLSISSRISLLYLTSLYPLFQSYHTHMQHICLIIMVYFSLVFSKVVKAGAR